MKFKDTHQYNERGKKTFEIFNGCTNDCSNILNIAWADIQTMVYKKKKKKKKKKKIQLCYKT